MRLRDVLNAQRYGFSGFELVDLEGRVVAAAGSSRRGGLAVERTYEVQPLFNAAKGGSGVLRLSPDDPRSPLAAPAIVETASGEPIAVLLLTLDPLEELRRASRDEGERAKISIFSLNHGWIATQSDSRQETSCDESPFDVLDRAGEHAVVEVGRAAVNLEGYRGCSGETLVGAWTSDDDIGVGVLAELSWDEAYQSYTTTRGSLVALGAFLSVALLALALQRRSVWELVLDTTGKPARNTAAWAILGVSLLATAVAWLSALQRVDRY
ncbi:MAG TPA: hypothetical protein VLD39_05175, partial [Gammaproteobacteria bacterium]|nr:hypothetical protein [Gammaproteobacteria bacterium]